MTTLHRLGAMLGRRRRAASGHAKRTSFAVREFESCDLPPGMLRSDGTVDLYDDVTTLVEVGFKERRPIVRAKGWVGHIPLNASYALDVDTRVPVANLEHLLVRATSYRPDALSGYTRPFGMTRETPTSLFDVLADRFLDAMEGVRRAGLLKGYVRRTTTSSVPAGRFDPLRSRLATVTAGRPLAVSSAFQRDIDRPENRVLKAALIRLRDRYASSEARGRQSRWAGIQRALAMLERAALPTAAELSATATANYVTRLPPRQEAYVEALALAQLLIADLGIAIREQGELVALPPLLVSMPQLFEAYVLAALRGRLAGNGMHVLNGDHSGDLGAKSSVFTSIEPGYTNPEATPDIVISTDVPKLVIDMKYKPPKAIPERDDRNQVLAYGARYGCDDVMILYPALHACSAAAVRTVGTIGTCRLHVGSIDLGSDALDPTEVAFAEGIETIVKR